MRPLDMLYMESGIRLKESKPAPGAYTKQDAAREQGKVIDDEKYDISTAKHLSIEKAEASKEGK